jgi:hypothetical protein
LQNSWVKYSGLAVQFAAFIGVGYWLGHFIATWLGKNTGSGELTGMLFFLITGLIKIIRDIMREIK